MSKPKRIYRPVPLEERYHLIAQAAYFRAERRGFQGGCPIQDWLEAEHEISQLNQKAASPRGALVFLPPKQRSHLLPPHAPEGADASKESVEETQ